MRKLAIALGLTAALLLAGGVAWKADATTWRSGTLNLPSAAKNFSPIVEDRLLWVGPPLPAGIPLVVWSGAVLVPPLLG
jgi:hypothetical protein